MSAPVTPIAPAGAPARADEMQAPKAKRPRSRLEKLLTIKSVVLVAAIAIGATFLVSSLRQQELADTERELENMALILAEQAEQTLQAMVLAENSIIEHVHLLGARSSSEFNVRMSTLEVHQAIRNKMSGLPFIDAISVLSTDGRLINSGRVWPTPSSDFSDRPYFTGPMTDLRSTWHLSEPLQSRADSASTIHVSRRVAAPSGETLGIISGAIKLAHFETFFASIALRHESSISLFRQDGVLLGRHPPSPALIGGKFADRPNVQSLLGKPFSATLRARSSLDGQNRLFAAHQLKTFPITVVVTTTASAALAHWYWQGMFIGLAAAFACLAISVVYVLTLRELSRRQDRTRKLERDRAREFLDRVIDSVPSIIVVKDAITRRYVLINKAGERLFGLPRHGILGKTVFDLFPKDRADAVWRFEDQVIEQRTDLLYDEHEYISPVGLTHYVTSRADCVRDANGAPQYLLAVLEDVTERRSVRQQLQQAQRMEAVGRLTGGLAHDFNNLLLIMVGNLDLLARDVEANPPAAEKVETIMQASLRGADLTRQLLAFSRRQPLAPKRLQANDLIQNTTNLLQRTLGQDITIQLKLADDVWPVTADEAQLEAALINIAINARDAMPGGGRLFIETHNTQFDQDYCDQHSEVTPGDYIAIEITDTGTGMPPEVLSRIFEPFFTTKAPGLGTGLGLATVFGFVRQSGGHISAYSEVDIGTTFKVYLPRADESAAEPDTSAAAPSLVPDKAPDETILVVDDNQEIRQLVAAQLTELGYHVIEADDAFDALGKLETVHVDLLFTDMVMPGEMNGKQLATIARFKHAGLKVLFTSGFPGTPGHPGMQLEATDVLLKKPYRTAELARAVRDLLDSTAGEDPPPGSLLAFS